MRSGVNWPPRRLRSADPRSSSGMRPSWNVAQFAQMRTSKCHPLGRLSARRRPGKYWCDTQRQSEIATMKFRTKLIGSLGAAALVLGVAAPVGAITWGVPDTTNLYRNVASVRGIVESQNLARVSCSGSLLSSDAQKIVILTAAHCTDAWSGEIAAGTLDSVGVSFDQNNQVNGGTSDATFYIRGGVPISFPAKDAPFETFDYGLVVFPANATNSQGQTATQRWGALSPVHIAPDPGYLASIISSVKNPSRNLLFTAVGYG